MTVNPNIKKQIIIDTAKYNSAHYSSQFLGFFTSIAMRRFLGPYYIGIWNILQVISSYFNYLSLGLESAAQYKIPFFRGKGEEKNEIQIINCVFAFLFLVSLLSAFVLLIAVLILRNRYSPEIIIGLVFLSIFIILQRLYTYYLVVLRARSNFSVISKSVLFDSFVNLILVILLVKNFNIYGLYVCVVLMPVLNVLFIHYLAKYNIRPDFNWQRIFELIKYSFPFLVLGVLGTILRSLDRIMIAKMLGVTFVGYYSVALMSKNYVGGLYNNFGIVTIPRVLEAYGKEAKIEHIKKFVTVTTETIAYIFPILLAAIFFISPLIIKAILPKFIPGIVAMQILLIDVFFQSCYPQVEPFLIALNKQKIVILITSLTIFLNIIFNYYFIKNGLGINGVALGTSISSFFTFLISLVYAMKHFATKIEIVKFILKIFFPLVYIFGVIISCSYFIRTSHPVVKMAISLVVLVIFSVPLLYYIDKKTHILRLIIKYLKNKLKA